MLHDQRWKVLLKLLCDHADDLGHDGLLCDRQDLGEKLLHDLLSLVGGLECEWRLDAGPVREAWVLLGAALRRLATASSGVEYASGRGSCDDGFANKRFATAHSRSDAGAEPLVWGCRAPRRPAPLNGASSGDKRSAGSAHAGPGDPAGAGGRARPLD